MKNQDFTEASALLKVLGHPLRLKIVCGLMSEPANLSRIARDLELPVSTVAQHLGVLRRGGLLEEERRGVEVLFRVADARIPGILSVLCHPTKKVVQLPRWKWQEMTQ